KPDRSMRKKQKNKEIADRQIAVAKRRYSGEKRRNKEARRVMWGQRSQKRRAEGKD
ncbi:hypothetical protein AVEN_136051-1, partial [Araneus ventricosus]